MMMDAKTDSDAVPPWAPAPAWQGWGRVAIASFVWLFLCGVLWIASGAHYRQDGMFLSVFLGLVLGAPAFAAALCTFVVLSMRLVQGKGSSTAGLLFSMGALFGGHAMHWAVYEMYLSHLYPHYFAHGRRLHRGREILAPKAKAGDGWLRPVSDVPVICTQDVPTTPEKDAIAAQWRENAAKEHASIAAFAHLTIDLLAVGAPARLVTAAQKASVDECRHAEISYTVAARIDGRSESPAPFPDAFARRTLAPHREIALAQIAVDALADGALNEGLASRILARLAKRAAAPELAETLTRLATDEARHAKDSWDVIEWCAAVGGATVARALDDARKAMPISLGSPLPLGARDGAWEAWGIQSVALEVSEYSIVRRHAQRRLREILRLKEAA